MRYQLNESRSQSIDYKMAETNESSGQVAIVQDDDNANSISSVDNQHRANPGSVGDDINATAGGGGLFGYSQLHVAASNGQAALLKLLLAENSSDVNGKTDYGGYTPLHLAASAGRAECIKELLKCHKTDIHVTDAFGRTPLETAEQNFKTTVATLLRSHGKNLAC